MNAVERGAQIHGAGTERVLRRAPRQFAAVANFGTRTVWQLGPRHWRMDFEDEIVYPEVLGGLILALTRDVLHLPGARIILRGRSIAMRRPKSC